MKKYVLFAIISIFTFLLVACGGNTNAPEPAANNTNNGQSANGEVAMAEESTSADQAGETGGDTEAEVDEPMADAVRPDWHFLPFTDVRTGETFTFADLAGKTVYVEPMATWCTNCRRQLMNVAEAQAQLAGNEDIVFVALSVEPNIDDASLLDYTNAQGFNFPFGKASPELLQGLVDSFGRNVTNPPSTPHFTIWPDGSMTDLTTGFESSAELINNLQG